MLIQTSLFVLALLTAPAIASDSSFTIKSEVANIDLASPNQANEPHLIYLMTEGVVATLDPQTASTKALLPVLEKGLREQVVFDFTLNEHHKILDVKINDQATWELFLEREAYRTQFAPQHLTADPYSATVLPDIYAATEIFGGMNRSFYWRAQCYNKAHVWAYEEFHKKKLSSMKVFLFFTAKYIREYNYHWWFHVSPYVLVQENDSVAEKVIDRSYTKYPLNMKTWTDFFIQPMTTCPTVAKYSEYYDNQYKSYCYLIKVSMFYWQPWELKAFEETGAQKTEFIPNEINYAYRAFRYRQTW